MTLTSIKSGETQQPLILNYWLAEDNSLIIQLYHVQDNWIRILPWPSLQWGETDDYVTPDNFAGIKWLWHPASEEIPVNIFRPGFITLTQHAILQFVFLIPESIRNALNSFQYHQMSMLQLTARNEAARELLTSNPNLFWLFIHYYIDNGKNPEFLELLSMKRRKLLGKVTPTINPQKCHINFLKRLILFNADFYDLEKVTEFLFRSRPEYIRKRFHSWPIISLHTIDLLEKFPFLQKLLHHELLNLNKQYDIQKKAYLLEQRIESIKLVWNDIKVQLDGTKGRTIYRLSQLSSLDELNQLHQTWTEEDHKKNYFNKMKENPESLRPYPDFPLPLAPNDSLIFLSCRRMLINESQNMKNCLYYQAYHERALYGKSYYFHINNPNDHESYSIEIQIIKHLDSRVILKVIEVKKRSNIIPDENALNWINQLFVSSLPADIKFLIRSE